MNIRNWLILKSNNSDNNIFCKPTSCQEAINILANHFLGNHWYSILPAQAINQIITEIVSEILINNPSYQFKQYPWWKKLYLKIYCWIKNIPIYNYY